MDWALHVLVDPVWVPLPDIPRLCCSLRDGGATVLQLRGKTATARELIAWGKCARPWLRESGLAFFVDDRVDVALAVDADGVHVGQDDVEVADVRRIAPGLLVGASAGTLAELEAVVAGAPDYIGVGPVYPTPSKADAGDAMGLSGLRAMIAAVHAHNLPVVAIGGITQRNAAAVWAAGVDGMATISAVMGAPSWLEACRGLRASDPAAKIRPQRD